MWCSAARLAAAAATLATFECPCFFVKYFPCGRQYTTTFAAMCCYSIRLYATTYWNFLSQTYNKILAKHPAFKPKIEQTIGHGWELSW